jgi:hypothetical protein
LIVEAAKRAAGTGPNTLEVLFFVVLVLLASYLIGSLARSITVSLYVLIWRLTNRERGAEAASGAGKPARTAARCEAVANKSVAHARGKLREARRRPWEALRAATIALIGARMSSDTLWSELKETYRKGELERALEAHPRDLRVGYDDPGILRSFEYCYLWLQRYAQDLAIPAGVRRVDCPHCGRHFALSEGRSLLEVCAHHDCTES